MSRDRIRELETELEQIKHERKELVDASMFALGGLIAADKNTHSKEHALWLAKALKINKVQSPYVDAILADENKTA